MCGFTGFYTNNKERSRAELHAVGQAMTDALAHRGPDGEGLWQDPDVPVLLGHRRLAILDVSPAGAQPMMSDSGRYAITYNGEIYNFQDLRAELTAAGASFRGHSDTEIFLAGIEHWGFEPALAKINGMFAFALWDRKDRTLHLVRDRMGKKPLYVGLAGKNTLVFGSELKALRAHPEFAAKVNRETLALYLRYGYVPAPHCIYDGVWSLPPGHILSLPLGDNIHYLDLRKLMRPYWRPAQIVEAARTHNTPHADKAAIEEFENLLSVCVQDRMVADVPLGAFLSGGIDSSAIVALMQKAASRPVKTYTIGFQENGFNEAEHAAKVAAHLGTEHHELYVSGADALNAVPYLPEIYDEPFADISAIPTFLVSKFARESVTVALSGDGGDEMLGGYNRHVAGPALWARMKLMPGPVKAALAGLVKNMPPQNWDALRGKPGFGAHMHKLAGVLAARTPDEFYDGFLTQWDKAPLAQGAAASMPEFEMPPGLSLAEEMMFKDMMFYLPNDILTKVDRASMAVGLEARAPLLDPRIFEYVWGLPQNFKIRGGQGKWLLRRVLERHVPPSLFERPKQGFSIPVAEWLRGPLKDWAEDLLDDQSLREQGLSVPAIRAAWKEHQAGRGSHATRLWTVLMYQAWARRWL